ncbi:MAG TPA: LPXTG cell wall anchor domain-containing protein [Firmicutes bacterium]|nr:LPXTG cell wall anchor domain-containing protein [Bacillota bacterium]
MSVGVIGGADGPTAIYVTSSVNWALVIGVTIVIVGGIIAFLRWKKKK